MRVQVLIWACFLMLGGHLLAQKPDELFDEMKNRYPEQMAVILDEREELDIKIVNNNVQVTSRSYKDVLHLNENSKRLATDKVYNTHFTEVEDINAMTLVPGKRKYKRIKVNDFNYKDEQTRGVFFDDLKSINFVYPGVQPKSRTVLEYTTKLKDPRVINSFFFDSFLPVYNAELVARVENGIQLNYKLFHDDKIKINHVKEQDGNFTIYKWQSNDTRETEYEPDAPDARYYTPHLILFVEKAKLDGQEKNILSSASDLYDWYYSFVKDVINKEPGEELISIVNNLTKDLDDEEEIVKTIFHWVQDNINYVAFEDGMKGFVPQEASLVCEKRYGDCKGMASIIHKMLHLAGVQDAYITWIGSRDLPYKYSEVPSPVVDNHMIASYKNPDGEFIFLDATGKYLEYGFPTSMIQGKQALVGIDKDNYVIETVPVIPPGKNLFEDSCVIRLENGVVKGTGKMRLTGYYKTNQTYGLIGADKQGRKDELTRLTSRGNNKYYLDHHEVENLEEVEKPLDMLFDFHVEDYYKEIGDEIYLNMNLEKDHFNQLIDTAKRVLPKERDFKSLKRNVVCLEIPEGYELTYLPANSSYQGEKFNYTISYQQQGNYIFQVREITLNYLLLHKEDFPEWNIFVSGLNKSYQEAIILKKKK